MYPDQARKHGNSGANDRRDAAGVTRCLQDIHERQHGAEDRLLQLVYNRLRFMAGQKMRHERVDHTLQPTALANEVYLKLLRTIRDVEWKDSTHFYAICARMMRNILVDHARRRKDERNDVELFPGVAITRQKSEELIALDQSLSRLSQFDPRGAEAIELTHFLGLTQEEVAEQLHLSVRTVKRDLSACLKWLRADMSRKVSDPSRAPSPTGV